MELVDVVPEPLDDLTGPSVGVIELPINIDWGPARTYDLTDESDRLQSGLRPGWRLRGRGARDRVKTLRGKPRSTWRGTFGCVAALGQGQSVTGAGETARHGSPYERGRGPESPQR